MRQPAISIIIPVYNVRNFIERCVRSLLEQTLDDVEYIFVNDCTPDDSIDILKNVLKSYPLREKQVRIISHHVNKGLPSARNTGMAVATGEYIYHCDSDDFLDYTGLEKLYNAAKTKNADYVWCDWFLSFHENERYMRQSSYDLPESLLKGLLAGTLKYNVWNKLVKRSLYINNNIQFPDGHAMGEDMTMIRLAACAVNIAYTPIAFYHYVRINSASYTQTISNKHLSDICWNVDNTLGFLCRQGKKLQKEFAYFKLNVKLPFIIGDSSKQYDLWTKLYPEANPHIMSNKNISLRTRILQWMAWKRQFWFVKLYYRFVFKIIYGIIYR